MTTVERHVAWWVRRYAVARPHADDLKQESEAAWWLAARDFDSTRGATLDTWAWRRMYGACRAYLRAAGALRQQGARLTIVAAVEMSDSAAPERTDGPLVLKEAWAALADGYERRGLTARHAEAMARLDVGQTLAEAGVAIGVSRQRIQQVARRMGVHATYSRLEAA